MKHANFVVREVHADRVIIQDVGPWHEHPTITTDAEDVVRRMVRGVEDRQLPGDPIFQLGNRRLFYYDSEGNLDELVVADSRFVRFAPGPRDLTPHQRATQRTEARRGLARVEALPEAHAPGPDGDPT